MNTRRWNLLGAATKRADEIPGVTAEAIIGAGEHAAAYAELFADYGVDVFDPDDLFVVMVTLELARASFNAGALKGTVSADVATGARQVLRALELAFASFVPDEARA